MIIIPLPFPLPIMMPMPSPRTGCMSYHTEEGNNPTPEGPLPKFRPRDTFQMHWDGYNKFIVVEVIKDAVVVTQPDWLKSSTELFKIIDIAADPYFKKGRRYSKLRWWLKM